MAAPPLAFEAGFTVGEQIEARAVHPEASKKIAPDAGRPHAGRIASSATSRCAWRTSCAAGSGAIDEQRPGHVAMLLENHLELLALYGGCAYAGLTLFGVNTGLRGEVLAGVLNQSRARLLVVDERLLARGRARARASSSTSRPRTSWSCAPERRRSTPAPISSPASTREVGAGRQVARRAAASTVDPRHQPDGHLHLRHHRPAEGHQQQPHQAAAPSASASSPTSASAPDDVGYACMPLFHSNAMFVGFMPAFWVGGAHRRCASASAPASSCPTCCATASPSGTTSASRCTTCWPRSRSSTAATRRASAPRSPTTRRTTSATPSATAPRRRTSTAS